MIAMMGKIRITRWSIIPAYLEALMALVRFFPRVNSRVIPHI